MRDSITSVMWSESAVQGLDDAGGRSEGPVAWCG